MDKDQIFSLALLCYIRWILANVHLTSFICFYRVEYRQYEYSKKVQAKEEASKEALLQSEAKEQELERLREKVCRTWNIALLWVL